jgi:hypothetical protein
LLFRPSSFSLHGARKGGIRHFKKIHLSLSNTDPGTAVICHYANRFLKIPFQSSSPHLSVPVWVCRAEIKEKMGDNYYPGPVIGGRAPQGDGVGPSHSLINDRINILLKSYHLLLL